MNEDLLKDIIKKAVEDSEEPDLNRIWSRIDHTAKIIEKQQIKTKRRFHRKLFVQVAASLSVVLILLLIIGPATGTGEAFPFLFPFHRLSQQVIRGMHLLFQFDLKEEQHIPEDISPPPSGLDADDERGSSQVGFIDTDLKTLKSIYPGTLYAPDISVDFLKKVQYFRLNDLWVIIMDFYLDGFDVVFTQEDIPRGGVSGKSYDKDDARVSFYRSGGIEYLIVEDRYNIVKITWQMEEKLFYLSTNSPVEAALEIAQSVKPMTFDLN